MDFLDFKAAALIKQANPVLTEELQNEILSLKNQMNTKRSFVPFDPQDPYKLQPGYTLPAIHIYWLIGFIDAEGCFHVSLAASNNNFRLLFDLAQKGTDSKVIVLDKLVQLLKVGRVYKHYHDNI